MTELCTTTELAAGAKVEESDRGNPEGESTEPSMDSVSLPRPAKPLTTLLAPLALAKSPMPRTLVMRILLNSFVS